MVLKHLLIYITRKSNPVHLADRHCTNWASDVRANDAYYTRFDLNVNPFFKIFLLSIFHSYAPNLQLTDGVMKENFQTYEPSRRPIDAMGL